MENSQKNIVIRNISELIEKTNTNVKLLARLQQKGNLSSAEVQELESIKIGCARSKRLYDILMTRSEAFPILIEALQAENQSGAVKILKQNADFLCLSVTVTYDKNQQLGEGGSGKVYKGFCHKRPVAVKIVRNDINKAEEEIKILLKLDDHPNIVRYIGVQILFDELRIALELCDLTLEQEIEKHKFNLDSTTILKQCADGIVFLHENNVIHKDLKPANILVSRLRVVKIADLGRSKQLDPGKHAMTTSRVPGSYDWMAPELLHACGMKPSKFRPSKYSDIFSLGCIFFFVLTNGTHPFGKMLLLRPGNILHNKSQIESSSLKKEWKNQLHKMLSPDASMRPCAVDVANHQLLHQSCKCTEGLKWSSGFPKKTQKSKMECRVEFDYVAQEPDEHTIRKGDIISNVVQKMDGWYMGTLRGKTGLFPDNFVTILEKPVPFPKQKPSEVGFLRTNPISSRRVKVLFSYKPEQDDELPLEVGDVLELIEEREDGWWRGKLNGTVGIFPSNFVEEIDESKKNGGFESRGKRQMHEEPNFKKTRQSPTNAFSSESPLIPEVVPITSLARLYQNIDDKSATLLPQKTVRELTRCFDPYAAMN